MSQQMSQHSAPTPPLNAAPLLAVLDACVLVPLIVREVLFAAAAQGLFAPRWTTRIEEEWRGAALKEARGLPLEAIEGDLAVARLRFPDALVQGWEAHEGPLSLPDWNDRHVLAAAIAAGAAVLVTDNLRDFPRKRLAPHGVRAVGSDAFLIELSQTNGPALGRALAEIMAQAPSHAQTGGAPALLKRARLPRLAKAASRGFEPH
ncbi:MAG: PIN domain-containing protein [Pseudomonadota bacterium]